MGDALLSSRITNTIVVKMDNHKNLHYLFVTADEFPSFRPELETLIGKHLRQRGHKVDWIMRAAEVGAKNGRVDWNGYDVWIAPTISGGRRIDRVRKHLSSLRNELRIFSLNTIANYDFILVKDKYLSALFGLVESWRSRTKFVYWLSFPDPEASLLKAKIPGTKYPLFYFFRGRLFGFLLYRIICPQSDRIIVQSEEMKRRMVLRGINGCKITALPMGVDDSLLGCVPEKNTSLSNTVVYLGTLNKLRELDFLLKAYARIVHKHKDTKLIFVGDSDDPVDKLFLQKEAARLGIAGSVSFTGFLPREEALKYVASANLCVSPIPPGPVYDVSSPTKTLEYMALGRPVVANDIPDTREVLEGSGGGICTPYNIDQFSEAMDWILCNPSEARLMGEKGQRYIASHRTYSVLADKLAGVYASMEY